MNRLWAVESAFSITGANGRPPPARSRRAGSGASSRRSRPSCEGRPRDRRGRGARGAGRRRGLARRAGRGPARATRARPGRRGPRPAGRRARRRRWRSTRRSATSARPSTLPRADGRAAAVAAPRFAELAAAMRGGAVATLVVLGGNPAYDAPADLDFAGGAAKVEERRSTSAATSTRPRRVATGTSRARTSSSPGATPRALTAR